MRELCFQILAIEGGVEAALFDSNERSEGEEEFDSTYLVLSFVTAFRVEKNC
jgi:hypothetical protein